MKLDLLTIKIKKHLLGSVLLPLGTILLLYQNCGEVGLVTPKQTERPEALNNKITGTFCYPFSAAQSTTYRLADFYVLNLNVVKSQGKLWIDSNQNGVIDKFETGEIPDTVTVSKRDTDQDGLPDFVETLKGLNPSVADLNQDGIDLDGVIHRREIQKGTDPAGSDANQEEIIVDMREANNTDCDNGQPAYSFDIKKMPYMYTSDFVDTQNSVVYNLSHTEKQNNILILARLIPDAVNRRPVFLASIQKVDLTSNAQITVRPDQFFVLAEANDDCPTCQNPGVYQYKKVATGGYHTCAITTTQKVLCWGANESGQLGIGSQMDKYMPTLVDIEEVKDIALGRQHTCAIVTNGDVYCWGSNTYGQIGDGTSAFKTRPVKVSLEEAADKIALGSQHSCVSLQTKIKCWGDNLYGQLATNNFIPSTIPIQATYPTELRFPLKNIDAREAHTCLVDENSVAYCWGSIEYDHLCKLPVVSRVPYMHCENRVPDVPAFGQIWSSIVTNGRSQVGLRTNDQISWWNVSSFVPSPAGVDENGDIIFERQEIYPQVEATKVSLFGEDMCFITEKEVPIPGTPEFIIKKVVKCISQVGFYTEIDDAIDLNSNQLFSCAIDKNGIIFCWGENQSGQLGTGDTDSRTLPTRVL